MESKLQAIVGALLLLISARSYAETACRPSHVDGVWQTINSRSIVNDARSYSEHMDLEHTIRMKLGRPDKKEKVEDRQTFLYWIRGSWRESRSNDCKGRVDKVYTVAYAILKLSFKNGRQTDCHVLERAFVSDRKRPDPFRETHGLMPSTLQSCVDFIDAQADK